MKLAIIHWHDAVMSDGVQTSLEEAKKHYKTIKGISCGIVVNETKEFISLATDYFYEHEQVRQVSVYPMTAIEKIEYKVIREKDELQETREATQ